MPRGRVPINAAPYNATSTPAAFGSRSPHQQPEAAAIANDKGREIAEQLAKVKMDGRKESAVLPRAVMLCAAGHLIGDTSLIDKGKALAREVESVARRIAPGQPILTANNMSSNSNDDMHHPASYLSGSARASSTAQIMNHNVPSRKVSTCKVLANISGRPVWTVVDTGASTCAISLDCLRRNSMDHLLRTDVNTNYINADGRTVPGKGKVYNIPFTVGDMTTLISPTVTEALNYDLLIGNDVLDRIDAEINFGRRRMRFKVDPSTTQEVDIDLTPTPSPEMAVHMLQETPTAPLADTQVSLTSTETADSQFMMEDNPEGGECTGEMSEVMCFACAVHQLPPHPPNVQGWQRVSPFPHPDNGPLYAQWLAQYHEQVNAAAAQLFRSFEPSIHNSLKEVVEQLKATAGQEIMDHSYGEDYEPLSPGEWNTARDTIMIMTENGTTDMNVDIPTDSVADTMSDIHERELELYSHETLSDSPEAAPEVDWMLSVMPAPSLFEQDNQYWTFFEIFHNMPTVLLVKAMTIINPPWRVPQPVDVHLTDQLTFGNRGPVPNEILNFFLDDLSRIVDEVSAEVPGIERTTTEGEDNIAAAALYMPLYGQGRQQAAEVTHALWRRLQPADISQLRMHHLFFHYRALFLPSGMTPLAAMGPLAHIESDTESTLEYYPILTPCEDPPQMFPPERHVCVHKLDPEEPPCRMWGWQANCHSLENWLAVNQPQHPLAGTRPSQPPSAINMWQQDPTQGEQHQEMTTPPAAPANPTAPQDIRPSETPQHSNMSHSQGWNETETQPDPDPTQTPEEDEDDEDIPDLETCSYVSDQPDSECDILGLLFQDETLAAMTLSQSSPSNSDQDNPITQPFDLSPPPYKTMKRDEVMNQAIQAVEDATPVTSALPPVSDQDINLHPVGQSFFPNAHSEGITLFEPFGGMGAGLEMCLRSGININRYIYSDISPLAQSVIQHRLWQLTDQYPRQLPYSAWDQALSALPQDIYKITKQHITDLVQPGEQWLMIAGWECQDLSTAGTGLGLYGARSRTFFQMLKLLQWLQQAAIQHSNPPAAFLIENTAFQHHWNSAVSTDDFSMVCAALGSPVVVDAARVGSYAHRLRNYWTNLGSSTHINAAIQHIHRPPGLFVSAILEPGRSPAPVLKDDRYPMYVCNKVGQPRAALPTLMAYHGSYAFRPGEAGSIWDLFTEDYTEPTAEERERAMGYHPGSTAASGITEQQRCEILGKSMDANSLMFIWAICEAWNIQDALQPTQEDIPIPQEGGVNRPQASLPTTPTEDPTTANLHLLPPYPDPDPFSFPEDDILEDRSEVDIATWIDNKDLTAEEQQEAIKFLKANIDIFCFKPEQLGRCTTGCHAIDTGDAAPVKQNYYKMPFAKYKEVKKHVQEMLELGIIRPSNSPWAAPVHLVPKRMVLPDWLSTTEESTPSHARTPTQSPGWMIY